MTSKSVHFYTVPSVHHIFCMQKSKTLLGSKKNNNVFFRDNYSKHLLFILKHIFGSIFCSNRLAAVFFDGKITHNK